MLGVSIERKLESFSYSRGPKKEKLEKKSRKVGEQYSLLKPFSLPSDTALSFDSINIHTYIDCISKCFSIQLEEFCIGNLCWGS